MLNTRIFLILLFAIIFNIFNIGCSKKEEDVITFAVGGAPNEIEFWETLTAKFSDETGIKVEIFRQPTDTDQRRQGLVIPLKSGKSDPDVFLMDVAWIAQFAFSDWLEPLSNYAQGERIAEPFFKKIVELADKYRGDLIALPVYVDGGLLYYRKDLLHQYGYEKPPQNWDELLAYSLKIQREMRKTNPQFYGFVWQGAQYEGLVCNFLEFAVSNGGGIVIKDGRILLNTSENREASQFMYDLIHSHRISPPHTFTEMKEEEVRTYFQQGNALFERNWPYAWSLHESKNSKVKGRVGISPLPHFPSGRSVSTLGGWHIGISKYSDCKLLSWEFVKFVVSHQTQKKLALELGWNPGRKDVYTDQQILAVLPHFSILRDVFENATPRPNLPYYTQISEIIQRYISAILSGRLLPETALAQAEQEAQSVIERYKER